MQWHHMGQRQGAMGKWPPTAAGMLAHGCVATRGHRKEQWSAARSADAAAQQNHQWTLEYKCCRTTLTKPHHDHHHDVWEPLSSQGFNL
eukprot:2781757-Alexandrium_andersonii.AAC.1